MLFKLASETPSSTQCEQLEASETVPIAKGIVSETQMGCNAYLITISPLKIRSQPEDKSAIMQIFVYLLIYFEV